MELTDCNNIPETYQRFMAEKDKSLELFYTFKREKKPTTLKKDYWLWSELYLAKKSSLIPLLSDDYGVALGLC